MTLFDFSAPALASCLFEPVRNPSILPCCSLRTVHSCVYQFYNFYWLRHFVCRGRVGVESFLSGRSVERWVPVATDRRARSGLLLSGVPTVKGRKDRVVMLVAALMPGAKLQPAV